MKVQTLLYHHHEDNKGIEIHTEDRMMDLTVTVDYTGQPYAPILHLVLKDEDENKKD